MEDKNTPYSMDATTESLQETSTVSKSKLWLVILIAVLLLGLIVLGVFFLSRADLATTSHIRDIFIIFMALESIVIGAALVVLVVQIAALINLIQTEVKPILKSTSDTVNTLKGTTQFLSNNLVDPVIKLNGYMAGMKRVFDLFKLTKK